MSIVVTGAAGQLGRFVMEGLLEKVPADQITAVVRTNEKAAELAARGVNIAVADYNEPETFDGLFSAGDKVLLISSSQMDKDRVAQHKVVIDAAKAAGVALFAYTSAFGDHVDPLSRAHRDTEKLVVESGLPYALLRNDWYSEIFADQLPQVLEHGAVVHAAGDGRMASATRGDYAAAAVAVLTGAGHENRTYELSGDFAWSFAEFAAEVSRQSGKEVVYRALTTDQFAEMLISTGMPELYARIMAGTGETIAQGHLAGTPGDLSRLIGRPTTPIADSIASALK
ncbi:SDR family oxidoreductase [Streptomyces sp. NPDC096311]|uniref:SDR family oxidoreductase n=1 Tax=Streptomyces sp. NPDC096311 TaxID=3366083 RepID=UPI003823D334